MRAIMLFNDGWRFHKGDIEVPFPKAKGPVYAQSKTERKMAGPASYTYTDDSDSYGGERNITGDFWTAVCLPHDYVIAQDNLPDENNALGFFKYDNAWYRKHFTLEPEYAGKRVLLRNSDYPDYCSCHVRDPKVWEENGKYHMVLGARTLDDKGCVL